MDKIEITEKRICGICGNEIRPGQELKSRFDFDIGEFGRNGECGDIHRICPYQEEDALSS